jgi:hypothetical protein
VEGGNGSPRPVELKSYSFAIIPNVLNFLNRSWQARILTGVGKTSPPSSVTSLFNKIFSPFLDQTVVAAAVALLGAFSSPARIGTLEVALLIVKIQNQSVEAIDTSAILKGTRQGAHFIRSAFGGRIFLLS